MNTDKFSYKNIFLYSNFERKNKFNKKNSLSFLTCALDYPFTEREAAPSFSGLLDKFHSRRESTHSSLSTFRVIIFTFAKNRTAKCFLVAKPSISAA